MPIHAGQIEYSDRLLAGCLLGLNVIGRLSNSGGAELIAQSCRNRRVIIVGENDRKSDGSWPGKSGAQAVARKLESIRQRPVPVAVPPDEAKDLRSWLLDRVGALKCLKDSEFLDRLGHEFIDAVRPPELLLTAAAPTSRPIQAVYCKGVSMVSIN